MTEQKQVQMQIWIRAGTTAVYDALTDASALRSWLAESAEVDLPSARFSFWGRFTPHHPDRVQAHIRLLETKPGRLLRFAWTIGRNPTRVTFRLLQRGDHTVLSLIHERGERAHPERFAYEDFWFIKLENLRRFLDGKACEARVDFTQPFTGDVRHTLDSTASPGRIYAVLTQPRWVERWIASSARIDLQPGGEYDLGWGVEGMRALELEEGRRFGISWQEADETTTVASWLLQPRENGQTRISFQHSGFADDHANDGIWLGWLNYLNWIRSVAEYGQAWQPPAIPLDDHPYAHIYPRSLREMSAKLLQSELDLG